MIVIALAYWLLCMHVQLSMTMGLNGRSGSYSLRIRWLILSMNLDGVMIWNHGVHRPVLKLRYNEQKPARRKRSGRRKSLSKGIRTAVQHAACFCRLDAVLRIGIEDAAAAAVTAGAVRAAIVSAAAVKRLTDYRIRVDAQTGENCLLADVRCIFSVPLGDIMLEAASAAWNKNKKRKRKEGFSWKSIPLKA